jgi:hypothetical protein
MADKVKIPVFGADGTKIEKIGTIMNVIKSDEPWTYYELEDGTKIKIKQTLVNVVKLDGEKTPNGDPVYAVNTQPVIDILPKIEGA